MLTGGSEVEEQLASVVFIVVVAVRVGLVVERDKRVARGVVIVVCFPVLDGSGVATEVRRVDSIEHVG